MSVRGTWGGAVIVNGLWRSTREEVCVINVYAFCNRVEKRRLWDRLAMVVAQSKRTPLYIIGDLNSILEERERVGRGGSQQQRREGNFEPLWKAAGCLTCLSRGGNTHVTRAMALVRVGLIEPLSTKGGRSNGVRLD